MYNQFIKFSSVLLNTAKISHIEMHPNKYCIHIIDNKVEGFWLFTSGCLSTNQNKTMEICKKKCPIDYEILNEWLNKIN